MKEVAKLLGVELNEDFDIMIDGKLSNFSPHRITERGLEDVFSCLCSPDLKDLLSGRIQLVKRPWKPKKGEEYYFVYNNVEIESAINTFTLYDAAIIEFRNCFITKEEAEAHKDEMVAKMKEVLE